MKKKAIFFYYIILFVFCLVGMAILGARPVFAEVEDFSFKDFTADYYLSRDAEGLSQLRVVENLTAVFPNFKQNKGICRDIPFTNQDGANVTLPSLGRSDIKIKRNGFVEPIYSIEKLTNFYEVCTGDESYVLGEQVYTFEYEFLRVATEFANHQELYWDTNGNGWMQEFEGLTARVYVDAAILDDLTSGAWCYVGRYGDSGQDRCEITRTDDGFVFTTGPLKQYENLTFDIEFKSGTFVVPEPEKNHALVYAFGIFVGFCLIVVGFSLRKYAKSREKAEYYKGIFIKPEYQPPKEYGLTELAEIYHGKKKDVRVAMLLDLIVRRKIKLIKTGKKSWSFEVVDYSGMHIAERTLIAILNGGSEPRVDDTVEIKLRIATEPLVRSARKFEKEIVNAVRRGGLVENEYRYGEGRKNDIVALILVLVFLVAPVVGLLVLVAKVLIFEFSGLNEFSGRIIFGKEFFWSTFCVAMVTVVVRWWLMLKSREFKNYTKKGLEASRYMDGLRLYIRMAEAERLEFLQSVENVDVSAEGIVKLYEKLLPYAAVFGLEKSWMAEMEKYCQAYEIEAPDYLTAGIAAAQITTALRSAAGYVMNSTSASSTRMSSGGGGSSSGFSGGGGGGFSGGGGGGGGGGGR